ncbi:MAG: nitroreductase [Pyrinomonadaceae bacterium]
MSRIMNRRSFIGAAGGSVLAVGTAAYSLSDRHSLVRDDIRTADESVGMLSLDEKEILYLASLAPSGHNTQPWFVQYVEPYHWIIANDKTRWLPAVDPTQRETILSIGAFLQNLEYAAGSFGYTCTWNLLATTNQDERVMEVKLTKTGGKNDFDIEKIKTRRTVRSNYRRELISKEDLDQIVGSESDGFHYLPVDGKESQYVNEQTIEANRIQAYRDPAQKELADWIRFSSKAAEKYRDGLTTASMEINGIPGFIVRNFYSKDSAISNDFRDQGIDKVRTQVSQSAGWILLTGKDSSVATLLESGRRLQRLLLRIRERNIAIHPMTQILEERSTQLALNDSIKINETVQFILRTGYLDQYPRPVSLRRPVGWFLRK